MVYEVRELGLPHMVALEGFYRPLRESYTPTALLRWLPEGETIAVVDARAAGDESSASDHLKVTFPFLSRPA